MADTLYNEVIGVEITPYIAKTIRTPLLPQIVNSSLSGLAYVQVTGTVTFQTQVDFIINEANDNDLLSAWENGNLIKVIDGAKVIKGYIIGVTLDENYANGYHAGSILIQEERVE